MNMKTLHGTIHGNTIQLESDPGLADGQHVEVILRGTAPRRTGEGLLRTEGALADDAEWDAIMDEIQQARKQERRPQWEGA